MLPWRLAGGCRGGRLVLPWRLAGRCRGGWLGAVVEAGWELPWRLAGRRLLWRLVWCWRPRPLVGDALAAAWRLAAVLSFLYCFVKAVTNRCFSLYPE